MSLHRLIQVCCDCETLYIVTAKSRESCWDGMAFLLRNFCLPLTPFRLHLRSKRAGLGRVEPGMPARSCRMWGVWTSGSYERIYYPPFSMRRFCSANLQGNAGLAAR